MNSSKKFPKQKNKSNLQLKKSIIFLDDEKTALVRPMRPTKKDYAGIARCYNSFKDSDSWPGGFGGTFTFTGEFIEEQLKDQDHSSLFIVVAPDNPDKIVGVSFCSRTWNLPDCWYVQLLGVDPAYQGQKLGKSLLLRSTQFALEKGARFISLHTWGGNLKAMPLYKRQGYKWRPNTSVYMENYLPLILNFPYFRGLFTKYSWYDTFQPKITQEQDEEFDEKMAIYEYYFKFDEYSSLKVWIDRTVGWISGFHYITEQEDLLIKTQTPNSEAFTGIETFPVTLTVANYGKKVQELAITTKSTDQLALDGETTHQIKLPSNKEQTINLTGSFLSDTDELDMKVHTHTYSDHTITFEISTDGFTFPIILGKVPLKAMKIHTTPKNFVAIPDQTLTIPFELCNYTGKQQEIEIKLEDGKKVLFNQHNFSTSVDPYDSKLEVPAKVLPTTSTADEINISMKTKDGKNLLKKKLPIIIFRNNKAVSYELDQQLFLENKNVRVSLYRKSQPGSNELVIFEKTRGLKICGNPLILGYPFDEDGSEFYSTKLDHQILETEEGLWIASSAVSKEKAGVKVTRKLFIPNDNEPLGLQYSLENLSDKAVTDLGILCTSYWWPNPLNPVNVIIPFKEGIKQSSLYELGINLGKDPSDLKEGWKAINYSRGTLGFLFNQEVIEKIGIGERFPSIEFKIPELQPNQTFDLTPLWFTFTDSWQAVRKQWQDKYHYSPANELDHFLSAENMKKIGLIDEQSQDQICKGLILDRNQKKIQIILDAFRKTTFEGAMTVNFTKMKSKPKNLPISITDSKQWVETIKINPSGRKISSGTITFDTKTRVYEESIALGFYNSSKEVTINKCSNNQETYLEVDNGFLKFRGSKDYRGQIFYLSVEGSKNYLLTHYPEVKAFLWYNKFYGGIGGVISPVDQRGNPEEEFNKLNFTAFEIEKDPWKGIGFMSEIMDYLPAIKGAQQITNFLTLPDAPFILVQQEITNHSEVTRTFNANLTANLVTSNNDKDRYYLKTKKSGIATFQTQDYGSQAWREELDSKWAAFKKEGNKFIMGAVIGKSNYQESIYTYSPNLSIIRLGRSVTNIKIPAKETVRLNVLYLLTKDLTTIEPFTKSNLVSLLKD
ncbi:MAG: GNAT family N-acetyltransferase [Candidatus Heimdallarchaeota archaeon]|nr:GNAT family N-acetyltransferase [Candidatus Heimdallarchaeota archaeon]